MQKLGKKQRYKYSKLLTKKLEEMGLRDEIQNVPSNGHWVIPQFDANGQLQVDANGQVKVTQIPKTRFFNPLRSTLKSILNMPESGIQAFLKLPATAPEKAAVDEQS